MEGLKSIVPSNMQGSCNLWFLSLSRGGKGKRAGPAAGKRLTGGRGQHDVWKRKRINRQMKCSGDWTHGGLSMHCCNASEGIADCRWRLGSAQEEFILYNSINNSAIYIKQWENNFLYITKYQFCHSQNDRFSSVKGGSALNSEGSVTQIELCWWDRLQLLHVSRAPIKQS